MNSCYKWNGGTWGPYGPRQLTSETTWQQPDRWNQQALKAGERRRVFCASLADVFDNQAPDGARERLFKMIGRTRRLDWLLLTKRPENIRRMLPDDWGDGYDNVWLGVTAENQDCYDRRWPKLRAIPAKVRFISYEPGLGLLGILDHWSRRLPDWVICGGESGVSACYIDAQWARDLRDECERIGVGF